jgi:hypothetical protein
MDRTNRSKASRGVVTYVCDGLRRDSHEALAQKEVARKLADILDCAFIGDYSPDRAGEALYFVPSDTLVGAERARTLGIREESDFFGGVVPHAFVGTKTITHGLIEGARRAPEGWSHALAQEISDDVLAGFSVYDVGDARRAGGLLLERGRIRIKQARGIGGFGQWTAADEAELERVLGGLDDNTVAADGVVLEEDLADVETYSVGQARVGSLVVSYYGTQKLTRNNRGENVYGGSNLVVVRGGFEELLEFYIEEKALLAIEQARRYDAAAFAAFPEMMASRRNYDVAQGKAADGSWRSGVLEQSWRIGGASFAEAMALEAFQADRSLQVVRASTNEVYGGEAPIPADAVIYFEGTDAHVGPLTKYSRIDPHANP